MAAAAESPEAHVIEIRVDPQTPPHHHQQSLIAVEKHPLAEISHSPGHLLLLKLYQSEEHRLASRIGHKETHLDSLKRDAFYLSSLFFAFHALFFTLSFTSSLTHATATNACRNWWVPCSCSLLTSIVLVSWVQIRVCGYWKTTRDLNRERSDGRTVARCVQELRMEGASFDLSKEATTVQGTRRVRSSSVRIEWRPVRWLTENLVIIFLLGFTGLVVPATKFVLCI